MVGWIGGVGEAAAFPDERVVLIPYAIVAVPVVPDEVIGVVRFATHRDGDAGVAEMSDGVLIVDLFFRPGLCVVGEVEGAIEQKIVVLIERGVLPEVSLFGGGYSGAVGEFAVTYFRWY